ncbi:MAG: YbhB/YbcL family Raf kinase inhibitor-like protein [Gammaproteobacteria bacterium]|nr:MAG: YbhB/YbcL family Raf kinase inhibitor-like protein [Gammaproteobacteria bacterium]
MNNQFKVFLCAVGLLLTTAVQADGFSLSSLDIDGQITNQQVFSGFGCEGNNISPKLNWKNPPEGTKSFAITMYDPDAPTGSGWWHWVIFDIPATTNSLVANAGSVKSALAPKSSIQSPTDFGTAGYGGPCPPKGAGSHQYIFTIHALKVKSLGLKSGATPALVGFYLGANTLSKASIVGYYGR